MPKKKDPRLARAGVSGFNRPKGTPNHPKKSHVVVAKEGDKVKTIRFGEQGAKTAGKPKKGESSKMKKKRPIYIGRSPSASPATGTAKRHLMEQKNIIEDALKALIKHENAAAE